MSSAALISAFLRSRSTWACELKLCCYTSQDVMFASHAPRERVSWNRDQQSCYALPQRSRSTWACELKFNIFEIFFHSVMSRSTWACELKSFIINAPFSKYCHAPRERVSWNGIDISEWIRFQVTLHVSVWVEIKLASYKSVPIKSRSTWACELKFS